MAEATPKGRYGIVRSLVFEDGAESEAPFAWFDTLEIAERVLLERIDVVGLFGDLRMEGKRLRSLSFHVVDGSGARVEGARRSHWDSDLDDHLYEVLCDVRSHGQSVSSSVVYSGSSFTRAVEALDSLDLEAAFNDHGGYGLGVTATADLVDSSPRALGESAVRDLTRRFDDAAYERKLAGVGLAVHDGILDRSEIRDLYSATDEEIDFAEGVYERPSGQLSNMVADAPGEEAPVKRNADARALSITQGAAPRRDTTIRM